MIGSDMTSLSEGIQYAVRLYNAKADLDLARHELSKVKQCIEADIPIECCDMDYQKCCDALDAVARYFAENIKACEALAKYAKVPKHE